MTGHAGPLLAKFLQGFLPNLFTNALRLSLTQNIPKPSLYLFVSMLFMVHAPKRVEKTTC